MSNELTPLKTLPTIHLNGSAKPILIEDVLSVKRALDTVLDRMAKARPHPRDYPGIGTYSEAVLEWGATEKTLYCIQTNIESYLEKLIDL